MPLAPLRRLAPSLLVLALVAPAAAQESPRPDPPPPDAPPPAPKPPTAEEAELRLAAEGEEVDVDKPAQLQRIKAELDRLRRARVESREREAELDERMKNLAAQDHSPILAVRDQLLPLTLDEAIERALTNNPDYLVELLRTRAAAEGVHQARAAFDPALSVEASWTEARPPFFTRNPFAGLPPGLIVASNEQLGVTTSLTQRFITGTQVRAFWSESRQKTENQFSLNPSYQPSYGVEVTQPLLRGFGIDVNLANIHVAEANALQADATYADVLMQACLTVEEAYWGLVRAEEELKFQERSLESSLKFLDDTRRRREVGAAADLDVIIAQAGVATRREGVIQAENALEATRDQLLRLVQPSEAPRAWDVLLVPTDRPWLLVEPDLEVNKAVETAHRRRPDVAQVLLQIEAAEYLKVQRDNEVLPQVDLFSSLREDGLGGQHHSAWTAASSGRFYTWQVGLRLQLPLLLRSERSRARAAQLDLDRAHAQLRSLEATVVLDVRRTVRDVRTAKATIEATRSSRILAARRLRATRTQVEHGTAVPRDVLDDLAQLAQAEGNEVRAFINYRLSISRHERAKGTLLDRWVDKLDPRVRRSLDRQAYVAE